MFYVIEGFLDVILPVPDLQRHSEPETKVPSQENLPSGRTHPSPQEEGKHLFTVKPGGIAGYLGENSSNRFVLVADPSSIVVQHGFIRGHQGEDGHVCGVSSSSRLGTVIGETTYCPPDAC
jgi:hypothetical protein